MPCPPISSKQFWIGPKPFGLKCNRLSNCQIIKQPACRLVEINLIFRIVGVPRVWEKIAEKMQEAGKANSGLKKAIGNWAKKVATRHHTMVREGKMKPEQFDFQYSLAKKLVFSRIHQALGLDQTQNNHYYPTTMSGAAPLNLETFLYFQSIDILLPELYGCSETNGPSTTNGAGTFLFLRLCVISQGLLYRWTEHSAEFF